MYEEIRNKKGKLLFRWDPEKCVIEIAHKGEKDIVGLHCPNCTKSRSGKPLPDERKNPL